jgi:hypothetical protein
VIRKDTASRLDPAFFQHTHLDSLLQAAYAHRCATAFALARFSVEMLARHGAPALRFLTDLGAADGDVSFSNQGAPGLEFRPLPLECPD